MKIDNRSFAVYEKTLDAILIREYVSSSGIIFAVAWNGITHPDLIPLLGTYADQYEKKLKQTERKYGHRHLLVRSDRVIVEKWGHTRNLQGRAYDPLLLPPGMNIDEIK